MKALLVGFVGLLMSLAAAQSGVFSFVDLDPTPIDLMATCILDAPDRVGMLECFSNTELIDVNAFADCEDKTICERYAYPIPLFPEKLGMIVEEVYAELWERYVIDVTFFASETYAKTCNPGITIVETNRYAVTTALARYWLEVFMASLYYMPAAFWFNNPFPGLGPIPDQGAIVVPSFSLFPASAQYLELATASGDPRDLPYYFGPPAFPDLLVPFTSDEVVGQWPGLLKKEQQKVSLERATLLEYNQFGHADFFEAYGEQIPVIVTAIGFCPPPLPPALPVPIPLVPRAVTDWRSVAEGYPLPEVEHDPLIGPFVPIPEAVLVPGSLADLAGLTDELLGFINLADQVGESESVFGRGYFLMHPFEDVINCPPVTLNPAAGANPLPILEITPKVVIRGFHTNETLLLFFLSQLDSLIENGLATPDLKQLLPEFLEELGGSLKGITELAQPLLFREEPLCKGDEGGKVASLKFLLASKGFPTTPTPIFDGATDKAVREFQLTRGLEPDGIVNPPTWAALLAGTLTAQQPIPALAASFVSENLGPGRIASNPSTLLSQRSGASANEALPLDLTPAPEAAQIAQQVLGHPNITLWPYSPLGRETTDGADAQSNVIAAANLQFAKRSGLTEDLPGGEIALSADMLKGILAIAETHTIRVIHIAGGDHPSFSAHHDGLAFAIDAIDGSLIADITDTDLITGVMGNCYLAGALLVLGPINDSVDHSDRIECIWPDREAKAAMQSQ